MTFRIEYNQEKNQLLRQTRGVGFEEVIEALFKNKILDDIEHKNPKRYPNQRLLILQINNYIYAVPYVRDDKKGVKFLKTIYPSRVFTKKYLKKEVKYEKK